MIQLLVLSSILLTDLHIIFNACTSEDSVHMIADPQMPHYSHVMFSMHTAVNAICTVHVQKVQFADCIFKFMHIQVKLCMSAQTAVDEYSVKCEQPICYKDLLMCLSRTVVLKSLP